MSKKLKVCFIPSEDNDHKPHFLREKSIKIMLFITLLLEFGLITLFLPVFPNVLNNLAAILPGVLVSFANESRVEENLGELTPNDLLQKAAQMKADDMASKGYFSHVTPDGKSPWYFIQTAGYQYEFAGENLAVNFIDSDDVHNAWMRSPTHKQNILRGEFTEVGIATAQGVYKGKEVIFVAQFFGKPKVVAPAAVVANVPIKATNNVAQATQQKPATSSVATTTALNDTTVLGSFVNDSKEISSWDYLLSQPKKMVSILLYILLSLTILALILTFFIKIKIQDGRILAYGFLIVVILLAALYFNTQITQFFGEVAVGELSL